MTIFPKRFLSSQMYADSRSYIIIEIAVEKPLLQRDRRRSWPNGDRKEFHSNQSIVLSSDMLLHMNWFCLIQSDGAGSSQTSTASTASRSRKSTNNICSCFHHFCHLFSSHSQICGKSFVYCSLHYHSKTERTMKCLGFIINKNNMKLIKLWLMCLLLSGSTGIPVSDSECGRSGVGSVPAAVRGSVSAGWETSGPSPAGTA